MIELLLFAIAVIAFMQLLVMIVGLTAIHHATAETSNLHTTVDRNRAARWQG